MNLETMQVALGLEALPPAFSAVFEEIRDSWQSRSSRILSETYLREALDNALCLDAYRQLILKAAAEIRGNQPLELLICLLEGWIRRGGDLSVYSNGGYIAPQGEGLAYDFLHLFPAIPTMAESVAHLRGRGVPEDVIRDTMGEYDFCVNMCLERQGKPRFDRGRLNWITRLIRNQLIRIGRFKYDLPGNYLQGVRVYKHRDGTLTVLANGLQIHKSGRILGSVGHKDEKGSFLAEITETATAIIGFPAVDGLVKPQPVTLSKEEWQLCLSEESTFPRIHIPSDGSFDKETIAASFARAREIFDRCYPDYPYQGFFCSTWLLSQDLKALLKPSSHILGFQSFFTPVPHRSGGGLVFSFAFGMGGQIPEDLDALPENSSLQRAVKTHYKNGGYVHEGAGFFL